MTEFNKGLPQIGNSTNYGNFDFNKLTSLGIQAPQQWTGLPSIGSSPVGIDMFNTGGGVTEPTFLDGLLGTGQPGSQGWGIPALGAATGLAQSWLGFQNLGLAQEQFDFQKNAYDKQFTMQKEEYDRRKAERDARVAANKNSAGV